MDVTIYVHVIKSTTSPYTSDIISTIKILIIEFIIHLNN
jgi:hypothetical protein